jgi:gluconokinase
MGNSPQIFFVMGVSGSGKSTIGRKLAMALHLPFYDGDDFHPRENIAKMSEGKPLDDGDREPWLHRLNKLAKEHLETGAVIACSALKQKYRDILGDGLTPPPLWIYLSGDFETLSTRLRQRSNHFMPPTLLQSQFEALEIPANAIEVGVNLTPKEILMEILARLKQ